MKVWYTTDNWLTNWLYFWRTFFQEQVVEVSKYIPGMLWHTKFKLRSQGPATCSFSKQYEYGQYFHNLFLKNTC
jgi:hypothetical protein